MLLPSLKGKYKASSTLIVSGVTLLIAWHSPQVLLVDRHYPQVWSSKSHRIAEYLPFSYYYVCPCIQQEALRYPKRWGSQKTISVAPFS